MTAATYDLTDDNAIEQGSVFTKTLQYTDSAGAAVNLTGWTARMQIRKSIKDAVPLIELTTENGGITITPATGTIVLFISAVATAALNFSSGVYDLELVPSATTAFRLLEGAVELSPEVTR